jgi:hypothetical protein
MEQPLLPRRSETPVRAFEWARWARLCMAFGATINAGFSTLGLGLTIGWLACGPAQDTCTHHPTERFEQLIPPALGIGLLQGVLFRRVTGTQGDETGYENAIALYMPVNVSPRQAFQSLFAVALGWVGLAFPVFLSVISTSWFNPVLPAIPNFNPLVLTPDWAYVITVVWAAVLIVGVWGWVNAPRAPPVGPLVTLPKTRLDRAAGVVSFAALAMFGYSTGLPTLCAANSVALAGTNTWQTRLGYPDVGCAGTFNGHFDGSKPPKAIPDSDGSFYSATAFWLWVGGWISWIILTVAGIVIQTALLYRRAWAESSFGQTLGDRKKARLLRGRVTSIEAPARLVGTGSRSRSWSEPDETDSLAPLAGSPSRGSPTRRSPTRGSPGRSADSDRAGIMVTKLIMGLISCVVLAAVFCSLGFMLSGDAVYDIDYRLLVLVAAGCMCLTCILAVAAATGVQGPSTSDGSADGWRSLNLNNRAADTAVPVSYKLFVCDRFFTWSLTAVGTVAVAMVAVAALATASHMQAVRVSYQDTLGLNPYSAGVLHYIIFSGVLLAGIFALMFDTAQSEPSRRRRNAAPLTFFITLSMLLCVGISLSVSSSLSIFVMMVSTLAVVNGLCYSLAIHRSTLPSRRYTAFTVVLVLCTSCGLLYLSASVVGTIVPPWGCPTSVRPALAAGPPWSCIDLTATVQPTTVFYQVTPPLVTIITMLLLTLSVIAGGRWDSMSIESSPTPRSDRLYVYPATVLPTYGQPLFWMVLAKVIFFCFFFNFLGELLNLRSCTVVDIWEWTTCGPPHDIALDLMGTASMVGFFVTLFNFPEICQKGVMVGKVQPVDERILDRYFLRPWATGRRTKALREFVLLRAAMMGFCTTLYCGLPVVLVLVAIGPEKQLPFGSSGISWLGIVPRLYGTGWWDGRMSRWTFIWVKSAFAVAVGMICVVVGYAAGTSRVLLGDITARTRRLEKATLAELLPHPVHLVSSTLFICGCVIGSVGAACLNDTLVGTTCSYTQSVILLSVGWPAAGAAVLLELALPHVPMLLESWDIAMAARLPDVVAGTGSGSGSEPGSLESVGGITATGPRSLLAASQGDRGDNSHVEVGAAPPNNPYPYPASPAGTNVSVKRKLPGSGEASAFTDVSSSSMGSLGLVPTRSVRIVCIVHAHAQLLQPLL